MIYPPKSKQQRYFTTVTIHGFSQLELFLVIQTFPSLQTAMTDGAVFWGYGAVCLIGVVFTLMFVPETKDKVKISISSFPHVTINAVNRVFLVQYYLISLYSDALVRCGSAYCRP